MNQQEIKSTLVLTRDQGRHVTFFIGMELVQAVKEGGGGMLETMTPNTFNEITLPKNKLRP